MNTSLVEKSLAQYINIAEQIRSIEKKMHCGNGADISRLNQELHALHEDAKSTDQAILEMVRDHPEDKQHPLLDELISLMRHIHQRNQAVATQVRALMAIRRNEMQKIKKGNTLLQGYRPVSDHTGKRISISN